jgi:hypothetical protein
VKTLSADDSVGLSHAKVGHRQALNADKTPVPKAGVFAFWRGVCGEHRLAARTSSLAFYRGFFHCSFVLSRLNRACLQTGWRTPELLQSQLRWLPICYKTSISLWTSFCPTSLPKQAVNSFG